MSGRSLRAVEVACEVSGVLLHAAWSVVLIGAEAAKNRLSPTSPRRELFPLPAMRRGLTRPTETDAVTLVTCNPFYYVGRAPKRYIVCAVEVSETAQAGNWPEPTAR